jgi:transcriptional regulator with XRE-family HTH domain
MTAKQQITSFNEFWQFFCNEAKERGWSQTEFMTYCGLPKTRYNSFSNGELNLTAHYVSKIMEGLRVTEDYVEKKSGKKLTDAQKKALRRITWANVNSDIIDTLMSSKKLTQDTREFLTKKKK